MSEIHFHRRAVFVHNHTHPHTQFSTQTQIGIHKTNVCTNLHPDTQSWWSTHLMVHTTHTDSHIYVYIDIYRNTFIFHGSGKPACIQISHLSRNELAGEFRWVLVYQIVGKEPQRVLGPGLAETKLLGAQSLVQGPTCSKTPPARREAH